MPLSAQNPADVRPHLRARIHPDIQNFLQDRALVHHLVDGFGSPLNIVFPHHVDDNIESFRAVYKKHHLRGRIYFTTKPCKAKSILRRASLSDVGADVSSPGSLIHALACGFSPDRIEATGPKNIEYLLVCLQLDILINADSMPELHLIMELRQKLGMTRKTRLTVRLGEVTSTRMSFTPQDNTFGITLRDIPDVLDWLILHKDMIDFHGFSFHASRMNEQQRLAAMENQIDLTLLAIKKGVRPRGINIGGGFSIRYADDPQQWAAYTEMLKKSALDNGENLTWNNDGLGFRSVNGVVLGGPRYIDHSPPYTKGDELDQWLSWRSPAFGNARVADIVRDSLLELAIEPGRGLLDQCGITFGRVAFVKNSVWGETLVGLEMNQFNNHAAHLKQLCDPVIIPRDPDGNPVATDGVYYTGNLCVSFDMLQYNKTYPGILPQHGDIVAFNNTAAYMMDFIESETVMQPLARKVAVWRQDNNFRWADDQKYVPLEI